jgi:hypothetical protein
LDQVDERTRRELATTRKLYILWAALGALLVLMLCYVLFTMLRARQPTPVTVAPAEDFSLNSVTLKFINAEFTDPETQKDFTTLSLEVVRDSGNNFIVFFARSTDPVFGGLTPRQCVVEWNESSQLFVDPCAGAKWTRDGKYAEGGAPRDLDRFPAKVTDGNLVIQLDLSMGATRP